MLRLLLNSMLNTIHFHCQVNRFLLIFVFFIVASFSLEGRTRKQADGAPSTVEQLLSGLEHTSPAEWHQGMPFVFLDDRIGLSLIPEAPLASSDTMSMRGSVWTYDSMVAEEDWMGQQLLQLRFLSPQGRAYRYSTGRPMSAMTDTTFHPALEALYPAELIAKTDSILRARTLYILYNDERVFYTLPSDSVHVVHPKFVPVRIDSVCMGNILSPLRICFSSADSLQGHFFASLPGSRQVATSTPVTRFLSIVDPYVAHPDITPAIWAKIQYSQVQVDMTAEEVRLSWGRPSRVERLNSRNGMIELWYYSNNRILQIWDGRLNKIGIL